MNARLARVLPTPAITIDLTGLTDVLSLEVGYNHLETILYCTGDFWRERRRPRG